MLCEIEYIHVLEDLFNILETLGLYSSLTIVLDP
jgi:hypothetical protein